MRGAVEASAVVLTGGDAPLLAERLGIPAEIRLDLTLQGIRLAVEAHLAGSSPSRAKIS
jgi:pantothenate kinase type III